MAEMEKKEIMNTSMSGIGDYSMWLWQKQISRKAAVIVHSLSQDMPAHTICLVTLRKEEMRERGGGERTGCGE